MYIITTVIAGNNDKKEKKWAHGQNRKSVFVAGCTASGKAGCTLAETFGAEILSVDLMKVYKLHGHRDGQARSGDPVPSPTI